MNSSLKLAEETNNWGWYEDLVHEGVRAGAIDSAKGNLLLFRGKKTASRHHFENLAATNPDLAAEMINRGELDGYFSAAEQDEMMRSLRRQDDNRLTEVVEQTASRPKSKNDRQAVTNALLSGPVYQEELGFHEVYERDGDYSACAPQIDSFIYRVADMVRAGENITLAKRAGLLHDIGKPMSENKDENGVSHFRGHEKTGAGIAKIILERLRYPKDFTETVVNLISIHDLRIQPFEFS